MNTPDRLKGRGVGFEADFDPKDGDKRPRMTAFLGYNDEVVDGASHGELRRDPILVVRIGEEGSSPTRMTFHHPDGSVMFDYNNSDEVPDAAVINAPMNEAWTDDPESPFMHNVAVHAINMTAKMAMASTFASMLGADVGEMFAKLMSEAPSGASLFSADPGTGKLRLES